MTTQPAAHKADVSDLSLKQLKVPLAVSTVLSLATAVTDGLTLAGLAALLAGDVGGADSTTGGLVDVEVLASFPVLLGLVVATFVLNYFNNSVRVRATADWNAARRMDLIRAFREADFPTQNRYSGAQLSASVEQISRASQSIGAIIGLINSVVRTAIYIAIAIAASWQVSVVCLVAGGALVGGLRQISRRTRLMHQSMSKKYIGVGEDIGELAGSARELHLLDRWNDAEQRLDAEVDRVRHLETRSSILSGMVGPIYWGGTVLVGLAVAAFAGMSGSSIGSLATAGLLLLRSLNAAQGAQVMYQTYNDSAPYLDRVTAIIGSLRQHARRSEPGVSLGGGTLTARSLSLSHGNDVVVSGLSATFDGIGGIALVGPSGSGKSTTLGALSGMLRPHSGTIELDGVDLSTIPREQLSEAVGLLPQDPRLIKDSLRANLCRPGVLLADEELWSVLDMLGLGATVRGFDGGLDAAVGRAGEGFSGGELQRLGLARLVVNQPGVWLLDEPTSALDRENSDRVSEIIREAMLDHLVVLVTHRPELLSACRSVVVMVDGKVADSGPVEVVAARQPFLTSMLGGHPEVAEGIA